MAIKCENVSKEYRAKKALKHISCQIEAQTITGLIGRNGAGKTTLLKIIAGFYSKTNGHIEVFGEDPFNNLTVSANTIFVDDQMAFPQTLTLSEILLEAERFYKNWDEKLAIRLFDYFQFNENEFHHHLSKGKKSTFNMIVGLCARTALTIFDEPTTGMDSAVRRDFYRALLKDYLAHPRTIIISSHHLEELEEVLENILLIDQGEVVIHMPVDDMREYAIGITGNYSQLDAWSRDKEVYHLEKVGLNDMYLIVRNNINIAEVEQKGWKITNVSCDDLAVSMTQKTIGGIDDVFETKSTI